jgi:hypothetical protein
MYFKKIGFRLLLCALIVMLFAMVAHMNANIATADTSLHSEKNPSQMIEVSDIQKSMQDQRGNNAGGVKNNIKISRTAYISVSKPVLDRIKAAIQKDLRDLIGRGPDKQPLDISNIAGIQWSYICIPADYSTGLKASMLGLQSRGFDFSNFSSADETFLDSENGLTFIDLNQKILITVLVPLYINFDEYRKTATGSCFIPNGARLVLSRSAYKRTYLKVIHNKNQSRGK